MATISTNAGQKVILEEDNKMPIAAESLMLTTDEIEVDKPHGGPGQTTKQVDHQQNTSQPAFEQTEESNRKLSSSDADSSTSNKSGGPPGSGMHNGVLQANRQERTCYGRELWDCLTVLETNTKSRTRQMEFMQELLQAVKKGLDNFSSHITHATQIYKRKQETIWLQPGPGLGNNLGAQGPDEMVTTLGAAVESYTSVLLDLAKQVKLKADQMFRDLIEPSDLYCKHYTATNSILLEQAQEIWQGLHQSRTQMLFSKENYFTQMIQLSQLQRQIGKVESVTPTSSQ